MRYMRFLVSFSSGGWSVRSDRLDITDQLQTYPSRRKAICAVREISEAEWARQMFEVDPS